MNSTDAAQVADLRPSDKIRSVLFQVLYQLITFMHSVPSLIIGPLLPLDRRYAFVTLANRMTMLLLRWICNVRIEVTGIEHLPKDEAMVVACNHQSQWETFFLVVLIQPQATVLKRELLRIPFFGWALGILEPIAIDRGQARTAFKQLLKEGKEKLADGVSVMIFPQGTRTPPLERGNYNVGAAALAHAAEVPILPIAHNAGEVWLGKRQAIKCGGVIRLAIGEPISSHGKKMKQVHEETENWIENKVTELSSLRTHTPNRST